MDFSSSKEFLIGYWIIDVKNASRAYRIAARAWPLQDEAGRR